MVGWLGVDGYREEGGREEGASRCGGVVIGLYAPAVSFLPWSWGDAGVQRTLQDACELQTPGYMFLSRLHRNQDSSWLQSGCLRATRSTSVHLSCTLECRSARESAWKHAGGRRAEGEVTAKCDCRRAGHGI
jgi:hypothetical protein